MNEQLQNALATVITSAVEMASVTGQFLEAEPPLVAEEVLRWAVVSGFGLAIVAATPLAICVGVAVRAWRSRALLSEKRMSYDEARDLAGELNRSIFWKVRVDYDLGVTNDHRHWLRSDGTEAWLALTIASILSLLPFVGAVAAAKDALQALVAPRLYLLEYAADLAGRA